MTPEEKRQKKRVWNAQTNPIHNPTRLWAGGVFTTALSHLKRGRITQQQYDDVLSQLEAGLRPRVEGPVPFSDEWWQWRDKLAENSAMGRSAGRKGSTRTVTSKPIPGFPADRMKIRRALAAAKLDKTHCPVLRAPFSPDPKSEMYPEPHRILAGKLGGLYEEGNLVYVSRRANQIFKAYYLSEIVLAGEFAARMILKELEADAA